MKLWLSKNSEIPLREQLTRQIMAGISSGDLQSGDKLPSLRELALRFKIHQNTVSNAYQWLEENGWVEARKGSGVFVCELAKDKRETAKFETETELDSLISQFFRHAQRLGFSNSQIATGVNKFLSNPKPEQILMAENDDYLRQIILTELQAEINFPTFGVSFEDVVSRAISTNSIFVAMPETAKKLRQSLPQNTPIVSLKINSAQISLKGQKKPNSDELIAVVSGWEMFLRWAKTFLIAAGIEAENILIRDVREKSYRKGLNSCVFVICDSATAQTLPKDLEIKTFRLLSEDFLEEIKILVS